MNQESNPHSPPANFGEKVVDALGESLKDVEVTVQTNEGHFFHWWYSKGASARHPHLGHS